MTLQRDCRCLVDRFACTHTHTHTHRQTALQSSLCIRNGVLQRNGKSSHPAPSSIHMTGERCNNNHMYTTVRALHLRSEANINPFHCRGVYTSGIDTGGFRRFNEPGPPSSWGPERPAQKFYAMAKFTYDYSMIFYITWKSNFTKDRLHENVCKNASR